MSKHEHHDYHKSYSQTEVSWHNDPASDRQIDYMKALGVRGDAVGLTKKEAHDIIDLALANPDQVITLAGRKKTGSNHGGLNIIGRSSNNGEEEASGNGWVWYITLAVFILFLYHVITKKP